MISRFKKFFGPPVFDDPDKTRRAQNLNTILNALLVITLLWAWYPIFVQGGSQIHLALGVIGILAGMYALLKSGRVQLVGNFLALTLWALVVGLMWTFGGVRNSGFSALAIIVVIASLTIGAKAGIYYGVMSALAGALLVMAENRGWLPPYAYEPNTTILTSYAMVFIAVGLLLSLAIGNINRALKASINSAQKAQDNLNLLEQKRLELETQTVSLEQKNLALQMAAEVAHISAQIKNQDDLLEEIVHLLSTRLKIDHIGIFLADEQFEHAHLLATNSEEGREMLASGYKLEISTSAFGFALPESDVIACQAGEQSYFISQPVSLAESKTNRSYPIVTSSQLLGLINVQTLSPEPLQIDPDTFRGIVAQIALSLENMRLIDQLQKQVREIKSLAKEATQTAWKEWERRQVLGYSYNQLQLLPYRETFPRPVHDLLMSGKAASYRIPDPKPRSRLVAPIILRDNVIGVIGYEDENPEHVWHASEITLLETIAGRVSLALENSRLVADAQQRAEQERVLGQITTKVRETFDIETILQTAVAEIQKSYELEEAEIRLQASPHDQ